MKLTLTFYPKYQPSITLTVVYVPELDNAEKRPYLHVSSNTAYVDWENFKIFNNTDIKAKKEAFQRLQRID